MAMAFLSKQLMRKPLVMKLWERNPKLWKMILKMGVFLKYKTVNLKKLPNKIKLPSASFLYINPDENRGRALLINDGVTQARLTDFWTKAVQTFEPSIVLDVGVNYGECIFSTRYGSLTKIIGIEANQSLLEYIEQSRNEHNNRSQIQIIHAFASDKEEEYQSFYVDANWSGTSSGVQILTHKMIQKQEVRSVRIDTLLVDENLPEQTILFKVDVEGYEAFVLKGMERIFREGKGALGFIEFDSRYIEKSGVSFEEFFTFLDTFFSIYVYYSDEVLIKASALTFGKLKALFNDDHIHTDFILTTSDDYVRRLGLKIKSEI
jgi:FkbM family methyltransferase